MLRSGPPFLRSYLYRNGGHVIADTIEDFDAQLAQLEVFGRSSGFTGPGLEVRPSTIPGAGAGVFATRAFERGEFITRYEGELVRLERGQARAEDAYTLALVPDCFGVRGLRRPQAGRGLGSLANDIIDLDFFATTGLVTPVYTGFSAETGVPINPLEYNVQFLRVSTREAELGLVGAKLGCVPFEVASKQMAVVLEAIEDVPAGAELFVEYGPDYWSETVAIERQRRLGNIPAEN